MHSFIGKNMVTKEHVFLCQQLHHTTPSCFLSKNEQNDTNLQNDKN